MSPAGSNPVAPAAYVQLWASAQSLFAIVCALEERKARQLPVDCVRHIGHHRQEIGAVPANIDRSDDFYGEGLAVRLRKPLREEAHIAGAGLDRVGASAGPR